MRKPVLSDDILLRIEKPTRYLGGEYQSCNKDFDSAKVRAVFAFPDVYEIGMANFGMQIIYEQFNRRTDAMCDRVYSPWFDLDKILREEKIPLFAVESQRPIKEFDLLLVTLQYEMCYTNVLQILDLSQIPFMQKDRREDDPIVIGGGAGSYNPEPVADFFDCFYIGEGETQYDRVIEVCKEAKEKKLSRKEKLQALAKIPGIYVPSFYEIHYKEDGTIKERIVSDPNASEKIEQQLADFTKENPYPLKPIVPFTRSMMDRATLEVMRGCIRGCRFCQAGMVYRPLRKRKIEFLKQAAIESLENSGFEELNLSSLATSDYDDFQELMEFLLPYCEKHHVNIGIPSLRVDSFSLDIMGKIQDIKKTSLTFAPEAGSERLRRVINKGLTKEEILSGVREAFSGGWQKVKLYFMLGLPTESEEDVKGIPALANEIAAVYYETVPKEKRNGRCQVQISTSFFVPKPFTPFQWTAMQTPESFLKKAYLVKETVHEMLNQKSLSYHYHEEDQTELEGLFARGDRKVSKAILSAYQKGCLFDAWGEYLKFDLWEEALRENGISFEFYNYRERKTDEILPWDFIETGVSKEFLKREWEKALAGEQSPNCREHCENCTACQKAVSSL